MTATAQGQAAHARWLQARWPDMSAARIAKDWALLTGTAKEAWSAAGTPPELEDLRELLAEILGEFSSGFLVAATNTTAGKAGGWYKRAGLEQP